LIEELVAFHLAGAALALYLLVGTRSRRLLALVLFFLFQAAALHLGPWHRVGRPLFYASGLCGLLLLLEAAGPRREPPVPQDHGA
jgi:hypothetical protein